MDVNNEDNEDMPLKLPDFEPELEGLAIGLVVANSNTFCEVLKVVDKRDDEVKTFLFKEFGIYDQIFFNKIKEKEDFLKTLILELVTKQKNFTMTIKEFVEKLWHLERRPQKDVCRAIKTTESIILKEVKNSKGYPSNLKAILGLKLDISLDFEKRKFEYIEHNSCCLHSCLNNNDVSQQKQADFANQEIQNSNAAIENKNIHPKLKKVLLVYSLSSTLNELKSSQISWFKNKLDSFRIEHQDFINFLKYEDERFEEEVTEFYQKVDAIFILYDESLSKLFDEKLNITPKCKYKFIGRLMYREYYLSKFRNKRFFTFLINNCSSIKYCWLENIHKKADDGNWNKIKSVFIIPSPDDNNVELGQTENFLSIL